MNIFDHVMSWIHRKEAEKFTTDSTGSTAVNTVGETQLVTEDNELVSVQHPLPCDGDSVYHKDIDTDRSDNHNFSGVVTDYFDSLITVNSDSTANTPKEICICFKRTIYASEVGLGCSDLAKNFSNVKLELLGSGDIVRETIDLSGDSTKLNSLLIPFEPAAFNGIRLSFVTTDEIGLSNITIRKEIRTKSQIVGLKPDGTSIDFKATTNGNFKVSLEELENNLSVNSNTQLKTTSFDSLGNEGQSIIGIDYVAGKSGIDSVTESLQMISYEHHEIHSGSHYNYCDYETGVANGAVIEFTMQTPDTTNWVHLNFNISASEGATLELYEGATGVTGGTTVIPRNNNRNSTNTSDVVLIQDPTTITDDGNRAAGYLAGGSRSSGTLSRENELLLKQNTIYLVRITSTGIGNSISWCAEWYEHTNKN